MHVEPSKIGSRTVVARKVLLDTGFLVALVNRGDPDHQRCREVWLPLRAEVISVDGVLVEAAYLLRRLKGGPGAAIELAVAARVRLLPSTEKMLNRAIDLMDQYRDVPMDRPSIAMARPSSAPQKHPYVVYFHSGLTQPADNVREKDPYYEIQVSSRSFYVRKDLVKKVEQVN